MRNVNTFVNKHLFKLLAILLVVFLSSCGHSDNLHIQHRQLIMLWYDEFQPLDDSLNKQYMLLKNGKLGAHDFLLQIQTLEYANKGVDVHFERYIQAKPNSKWSHLLYGLYLVKQASDARGGLSYGRTSQASIDKMYALLEQATPYLIKAKENQTSISLYTASWLEMNLLLGARAVSTHEEMRSLVQEAMARDGKINSPAYAYLQMLYPQWGGSEQAMQDFIDEMRLRNPKLADGLQSDFFWSRGTRLRANSQYAAATTTFEKAVSFSANSTVLNALGDQYMRAQRCDEAVEVYMRNLDENDPWDLYTIESAMQAHRCAGNSWKANRLATKRSELFSRYKSGK